MFSPRLTRGGRSSGPTCLTLVVALAILGATAPVHACSCTGYPTFEEAYAASGTIFRGVVRRIEPIDPIWTLVLFDASATWRGSFGPEISIVTGANEAICGYPFMVGVDHLVYASGTWNGIPVTDSCWRTHPTGPSDGDLALLGPPRPIAVAGETWGAVKALYAAAHD